MSGLLKKSSTAGKPYLWLTEWLIVGFFTLLLTMMAVTHLDVALIDFSILVINAVFYSLLLIGCLALFNLYKPDYYYPGRGMLVKLAPALGLALLTLAVVYQLLVSKSAWAFAEWNLSDGGGWRFLLTINAALGPLALVTWRTLSIKMMEAERPKRNFLIIGSGDLAKKIGQEIYSRKPGGSNLLGFIDDDPAKLGRSIVNPGVIGGYGDIESLVKTHEVTDIVVALNDRRAKLPMSALLECKMSGVTIVEGATFQERTTRKIPLDQLKPSWLVFSDGFKSLRSRKILKRIIDLTVSVMGLIAASPIMIITALLIKLESKGPVIFSQIRVGEHGKLFKIFKFRSMRQDAEDDTGPIWAKEDDDRVTFMGKIIRQLRIDELPQLINVIRGDMSFVGPRPERPYFVERLKKEIPYYEIRHVVKPGVTGWAQVRYQYGASVQDALEKLQYDIYYIKNMSPPLDLLIILKTIKVVVGRIGSR